MLSHCTEEYTEAHLRALLSTLPPDSQATAVATGQPFSRSVHCAVASEGNED